MCRWRLFLGILFAAVVGVPAAAPFAALLNDADAWRVWSEAGRLLALGRNTLILLGGVLGVSLPLGIVLAVLLYRTDLPGRSGFLFLQILALLVPLPLVASGWQAAGDLLLEHGAWVPWCAGFGMAIWLHTAAGLPWVVLVAGLGLRAVERELEEESLTAAPPLRVLCKATLPRARAALVAAALWIALLAAAEITITDLLQIRTFAEEVYTQFVAPEAALGGQGDPVARALVAVLPWALGLAALTIIVVRGWERGLPAPEQAAAEPLAFPLSSWRWPLALVCGLFTVLLLAVPTAGLVWRAGQGPTGGWSVFEMLGPLARAVRTDRNFVILSLVTSAVAGLSAATLALMLCWAMRGTRWFAGTMVAALAIVVALPGPVLGIGLKETIHWLLDHVGWRWLAQALYYGPSPAPLIWVNLVRFLPLAMALLWPVVRLVPPELVDAARVDGAVGWREFRSVIWPLTRSAWLTAGLAVTILSLGELSAGKLVATPGCPGYAQELFARMHYGVTPDLAAGCLLLLAVVTVLAGLGWLRR